jgi:hypothetical protein
MKSAKIRLSEEEQNLVMNGDWILTKNRVLEQITGFLANLQLAQAEWIKEHASWLPEEVLAIPAKLSKGEQYLGLPYRVLDYPRLFGATDMFAIRTLFWWGHYFTVNLVLAGEWKRQACESLIASFDVLQERETYICTGDDPWIHQVTKEHYREITSIDRVKWEKMIREQAFVKLTTRHELTEWEHLEERLLHDFARLLRATGVGDQLPRR